MKTSAPPTDSETNILYTFEAGWGGVVTKTIGLHPVVNVAGPKAKFLRYHPDAAVLSMNKGRGGVLHSSWNWELISDKSQDWWLPRIERIKQTFSGLSGLTNCHKRSGFCLRTTTFHCADRTGCGCDAARPGE